MLNDFIGGGQIFLHKLRMFAQVAGRSINIVLLISVTCGAWYTYPQLQKIDTRAALTYQRAVLSLGFNDILKPIRQIIRPESSGVTRIDAYTADGLFLENMNTKSIINSRIFRKPCAEVQAVLMSAALVSGIIFCLSLVLIFTIWSKYGAGAKAKKHIGGSVIKTAKEVMLYLRSNKKASSFIIGDMPLVQDAETRHILVTGMTGSGKTNMINSLLPQVRAKKQPALVIDQTGEMISRYYNPDRGDIIFNPLDTRAHSWDFWTDVTSSNYTGNVDPRLEKFAKVLFKFGSKENSSSDPFWSNSAENIFCACVESLLRDNRKSLKDLQQLLCYMPADQLASKLAGTRAERYLIKSNQTTAASILSLMSTSSRPLLLLNEKEKQFSLKQYFDDVRSGSESWLFFSTPPSQREVVYHRLLR